MSGPSRTTRYAATTRIRVCNQACAKPADFCETHERDWKRLERDVKKALGEPGAN